MIIGFNPLAGDTIDLQGQEYGAVVMSQDVQVVVGQNGLVVLLSQVFIFNDA